MKKQNKFERNGIALALVLAAAFGMWACGGSGSGTKPVTPPASVNANAARPAVPGPGTYGQNPYGQPQAGQPSFGLPSVNYNDPNTANLVLNVSTLYLTMESVALQQLISDGGCAMAWDMSRALRGRDFRASTQAYCAQLAQKRVPVDCDQAVAASRLVLDRSQALLTECRDSKGDVMQARLLIMALESYRVALGMAF